MGKKTVGYRILLDALIIAIVLFLLLNLRTYALGMMVHWFGFGIVERGVNGVVLFILSIKSMTSTQMMRPRLRHPEEDFAVHAERKLTAAMRFALCAATSWRIRDRAEGRGRVPPRYLLMGLRRDMADLGTSVMRRLAGSRYWDSSFPSSG